MRRVEEHIPSDKTLIRSQAPHYPGHDAILTLNADDIKFLKEHKVDGIISFNQYPYDAASKKLLQDNNIGLLHCPVEDFTAQTLSDFENVYKFFMDRKTTLMHCGYGHGRTGAGVTAIQLYHTKGAHPTTEEVTREKGAINHIEEKVQKDALEGLRKKIREEFVPDNPSRGLVY